MGNFVWSYSNLKTFAQCAKKYYHLKVAKDVKEPDSEALSYGNEFHKAAELCIKKGEPLNKKFTFAAPIVEKFAELPGEKHTEMRLGISKVDGEYAPCGFFDKQVWWRGLADLVIIQGDEGWSVDWKTGKSARYADEQQLDIVAAALFVHFPQIKVLRSGLVFVVSGELVKKTHYAKKRDEYFKLFDPELNRMQEAYRTNIWNPSEGPLCGYCPVKSCVYNRER
jgi:hypothetical protein